MARVPVGFPYHALLTCVTQHLLSRTTLDVSEDRKMMSETDLTADELKELAQDALDTVDTDGPLFEVGYRVRVFVKNGEVWAKAQNSSAFAKASVVSDHRDALDDAGIQWEFKEDRRFRDDVNKQVVIITGVSPSEDADASEDGDSEPVTDGGEDVACSRCSGTGERGPDIMDPAPCDACEGTGRVQPRDAVDADGEPVSEGDRVTVGTGTLTERVETVHADGRVALSDGRSLPADHLHVDRDASADREPRTDGGAVSGTDTEALWTAVGREVGREFTVTVEYESLRTGRSLTVSGAFQRVSGTAFSGGTVVFTEPSGEVIHVSGAGLVSRATTGAVLGDLTRFTVEQPEPAASEDVETDGGQRALTDGGRDTERVMVSDLSEGDEILFGDRKVPLTVTADPWENPMGSGHNTRIEGPRGAEYRLSEEFTSYKRQRSTKSYRYAPIDGDGTNMKYVDEIRRVVDREGGDADSEDADVETDGEPRTDGGRLMTDGGNLPAGAAGHPDAPWNQPDPADRLPMTCERCGFRADTLEQMADHEHADDCFTRDAPERDTHCMVCCPPPDAHERTGPTGTGSLVFCERHDRADWKQKLEHEETIRRERDEPEVRTDGGQAVAPVYDTKTVRTHEPEQGRYVYLMITRFDGERSILGDIGYTDVYFQFDVMSQTGAFRAGNTAAYDLLDGMDAWFRDSYAFALISGLEAGDVDWTALADGAYLTPEDVDALTGREPEGEVRTDGGEDVDSEDEPEGERVALEMPGELFAPEDDGFRIDPLGTRILEGSLKDGTAFTLEYEQNGLVVQFGGLGGLTVEIDPADVVRAAWRVGADSGHLADERDLSDSARPADGGEPEDGESDE